VLYPKKVGTLPVNGSDKEKQTNEIKIAAPMLDVIEIKGRTITADALLTQRQFARYLIEERGANFHFTVKANQPSLLEDLILYFRKTPRAADFTETGNGDHGRIETRSIWTTTEMNDYLNFPYVRQAFMIERESLIKSTGQTMREITYGITSLSTEHADPEQILKDNRRHWRIESSHYIIDWNYDEDRSQIRTGFGPENITRLRRFAIGLIKGKRRNETTPETMKKLLMSKRMVLDFLKMTRNANAYSMG
jgi:predicted transposase YbfD/YdcC